MDLLVIARIAGFYMCTYMSIPASELGSDILWVNFHSISILSIRYLSLWLEVSV